MYNGRKILNDQLEAIINASNVYYQPPENLKMVYPCFRYNLSDSISRRADNLPYNIAHQYNVTYISKKVNDNIINQVLNNIEYSSFDRWYAADGLNHYVFTIYK